ncbi:hypothetical protein FRC01_010321, partial [Tulasnella sp. 417]
HGVVDLPELLSIIFSNLRRRELARAARVCRTWSPIALDYLWENIDDLPQLFRVYSPQRRSLLGGPFHFKDVSNGGCFDAFWTHARRIRNVEACHGTYASNVIPHLLDQVKKAGYGQTFLPNLRKILFAGSGASADSPQFLSVFPLIPATLENLSFGMFTALGTNTAFAMLQSFTRASMEHLKTIYLGAPLSTSQDLRLAFTTFIGQQKDLEELGIWSLALSAEDVRNIGSLPRLTRLDLHHGGDPCQDLTETCTAIGNQFPNLQKLSIINKTRIETDILVLEGLAPCCELRTVALMCRRPGAVTAEAIQRLGRGWPRLEKLSFEPWNHDEHYDYYEPTEYPGAPIGILEDVALCWSETITAVSLIFSASDGVPEPFEVQGRFKKLRQITVDHCRVYDYQVHRVAEFVAAMCTTAPGFEYNTLAETPDDWYAVEEEVEAIIKRRQA